MTYYMLFTREHGRWCPQFGDHDKECVEYERDEEVARFKDGMLGTAKKDTKIVSFPRVPTRKQVEAKTEALNA